MLMDIRTMSVRKVFKAHQKEVTALCWHPETDALLASGGYDSGLHFWDMHGASKPIESLPGAHDGPIWCLAWHPLGHLLVSGSHDYSTRFWSRARPGDKSFINLLPKKAPFLERDPPAPVIVDALSPVYEAGIFAGPSLPAPPPGSTSINVGGIENTGTKATEPVVLSIEPGPGVKALTKPTPGLSQGEGPGCKDVLDTSDFDAEEAAAMNASTGIPLVVTPVLKRLTGGDSAVQPDTKRPRVVEAAKV